MRTFIFALLFCFTPLLASAASLKVVNVSAPAINCVFNPACTVSVNDTTDNIAMSTGGTGFLQSRTFKGAPGWPATGLFAYEYRIDLRNAVGAVAVSCIDWMTISFGPAIGTLNYGGDAKPDQVFVVTSGGIGTIGIRSAVQTGSNIKFKFSSPICEGGAPGKGNSSFFWGLTLKCHDIVYSEKCHDIAYTLFVGFGFFGCARSPEGDWSGQRKPVAKFIAACNRVLQ